MVSQAMISITYKDKGIPVYRTCKEEGEPHPALILIHEVWGLSGHIKDVANRLCAEGFEVIAPDLLADTDVSKYATPELQKALFDPEERLKHQVEIRAMMAPLGAPGFSEETMEKLEAVFKYLKDQPAVTKIGVIGFCFGGTYGFGLATREQGLSAALPFYGHGEQWMDGFKDINCPVMAFYGQKDETLNAHIPEIEKAMQSAGKQFRYEVYPGAGHAFFNDTNPLAYNGLAAKDAWTKSLVFLHENLD
ncbi:MAG TPA: dienelactone hydrolase family protein [Candidatus Saccharimonadales bacterium]|nr:dienelactone hydrolase family protein [Candidatus Saccharimonadales bacterium]